MQGAMGDVVERYEPPPIPSHIPIIDLTGDDDENHPSHPRKLKSQNLPVRSTNFLDITHSQHGLASYGSFPMGSSLSRSTELPKIPDSPSNLANPAKRRKLDDETSGSNKLLVSDNYEEVNRTFSSRSSGHHKQSRDRSGRAVLVALDARRRSKTTETPPSKSAVESRLKNFLQDRVVPLIRDIVDRYSFDDESAKDARKETLKRIFEHDRLRKQVEGSGGQLSKASWKYLELQAENLVARIASGQGVLVQGKEVSQSDCFNLSQSHEIASSTKIHSGVAGMKIGNNNLHQDADSMYTGSQPERGNSNIETVRVANSAEVKKKLFAEKMSSFMKHRWANGEMAAALERKKENRLARTATATQISNSSFTLIHDNHPSKVTLTDVGHDEPVSKSQAYSKKQSSSTGKQMGTGPTEDSTPHVEISSSEDSYTDDESQIRRYSSSPTTSFSAEGGNDNLAAESTRGDSKKVKISRRVFHLKIPSTARLSNHSTVQRKTAARSRSFHSQSANRQRKRAAHDLDGIVERDAFRLAGLESCKNRPYLSAKDRSDIQRGLSLLNSDKTTDAELKDILEMQGFVFHVDLCSDEILSLVEVVERILDMRMSAANYDPKQHIQFLMSRQRKNIPDIVLAIGYEFKRPFVLRGRSDSAISSFLEDAANGELSDLPSIVRLSARPLVPCISSFQKSILSVLRDRQIYGNRRKTQNNMAIRARLITSIEDTIVKEVEWTDCAGDIATICWLPRDRFICGTVTHSDEHNQQYNKPGNLMVGCCLGKSLQSIAGHHITRPIVEKGDNALPSMRETQDPWLYTSVTSTAYSHEYEMCFTGSFDETVKIWRVNDDQSSMELLGTWHHGGHVNFVVTSPNHGMIATAADTRDHAIRVYKLRYDNPSESEFSSYSGEYARQVTDRWAYFPATIQWGKFRNVSHLLLVGYSPRAFDPHEDVPEDKANTGELCLWNMIDGSRIPITSARTQNVFEVVWHPTQPIFVAATSPTGVFEDGTGTQLRIFGQTEFGAFSVMTTLDCGALDINEITIMPNSQVKCYVTASCTDRCTYVWDSAAGDKPIHVLRHDDSIDDQAEGGDNGVKFASWGSSADRFYTGSSDGIVKCWNPRTTGDAVFIRDVASLSGGVSAGAFSHDHEKLLIGDSTGKVHLFSLDEMESGEKRPRVLRKQLTPHSQPLPPANSENSIAGTDRTAVEIAQDFISKGQIVLDSDEYIGAVQGPEYSTTGLFAPRLHKGNDIERRVKRSFRKLQFLRYEPERLSLPCLPPVAKSSGNQNHVVNVNRDLDATVIENAEELDFDFFDNDFEFDLSLSLSLFNLDDEVADNEEGHLQKNKGNEVRILENEILQELQIQRDLNLVLEELSSEGYVN